MTRKTLIAVPLVFWLLTTSLAADQSPSAADLLPVNSVWAGEKAGDERHARSHAVAVRLTVTERDGNNFTARFIVAANPRRAVELQGQLNDKGEIRAKVTTIVEGQWPQDIKDILWEGAIKDDTLKLQYAPRGDRVQSVELKQVENPHRRRGRSGSDK